MNGSTMVEPRRYCTCKGTFDTWPTVCPASGEEFHVLRPGNFEAIGSQPALPAGTVKAPP